MTSYSLFVDNIVEKLSEMIRISKEPLSTSKICNMIKEILYLEYVSTKFKDSDMDILVNKINSSLKERMKTSSVLTSKTLLVLLKEILISGEITILFSPVFGSSTQKETQKREDDIKERAGAKVFVIQKSSQENGCCTSQTDYKIDKEILAIVSEKKNLEKLLLEIFTKKFVIRDSTISKLVDKILQKGVFSQRRSCGCGRWLEIIETQMDRLTYISGVDPDEFEPQYDTEDIFEEEE